MSDTWRVREEPEPGDGHALRATASRPTRRATTSRISIRRSTTRRRRSVLNPDGAIARPGANRYTGLITAGDGVPEDQQDRVTIDPAAATAASRPARRAASTTTQHLFMPRFSGAYTLNARPVIRGGVGAVLRQARRERHLLAGEPAAVRAVSVSVENGNLANPLAGAARPPIGARQHQRARSEPRQCRGRCNYSIGVQRELPRRPLRRGHLRRQPAAATCSGSRNINIPTFEALRSPTPRCRRRSARTPTTCVPTGLLAHPPAPQRRVLGLQQPAAVPEQAARRHPVTRSATRCRQGDRPRQRQRRQPLEDEGCRPTSRLRLLRRADVLRSPPRAGQHARPTRRRSCASGSDILGHVARRLGDQRQGPLAVGAVPDVDRQHVDRHAARRLRRRRHRPRRPQRAASGSTRRRSRPRRTRSPRQRDGRA